MSIKQGDLDIGGWGLNPLPAIGSLNVSADPDPYASEGMNGFFKGVTDFFGGLAGVFNNGVDIYKSVAGQYNAAQAITNQTSKPALNTVATPGASFLTKDFLIKAGLVIGIGAVALLLIRKR